MTLQKRKKYFFMSQSDGCNARHILGGRALVRNAML